MPRFSVILRALSLLVLTLSIVGAAAGPRATVSATAARKLTLWLDWYPTSDHAGIYVALAKGFYAREGLDVSARIPSGAADATQLLAHGTGDIGISYEPTVLLARARGIPIVATAAIVQRPLNVVLSLAGSGIVRPRQLEGRTVGLAGDPSDYTDLQAVVSHDGGDYAKVRKVVVNYALLQGLLAKKVDAIIGAYWSWEALQADQGGHPVNVMRLDRFGVPTYDELVFVTGRGQLAREPSTLRAFLRADPDVIMVGEIRDNETAQIAVESSLTGHLVLSTLHTNSAPETITRLLDMGMDPFNFADALLAVLAQRLVRRICSGCKTSTPATDEQIDELLSDSHHIWGDHPAAPTRAATLADWTSRYAVDGRLMFFRGTGCAKCGNSGVKGRAGVHELLTVSKSVRHLIQQGARAEQIQHMAMGEGLRTLRQDGIEKVLAGVTTIEEVRATSNS